MLTQDQIKNKLGKYAADLVPRGATIGMGTGSTIFWLIEELKQRVKVGFEISVVPTSRNTSKLAREAGIRTRDLNDVDMLPLTIDGADEVDPGFQLIKGGGGALLQEKMVAAASNQLIILADESKLVRQLGKFHLPVEVIPFGWRQVQKKIVDLGCNKAEIRLANGEPFVTDHGHFIIDCQFGLIDDAAGLNVSLHLIPGVVETGLFINMATETIVGYADGRIERKSANAKLL
jgi:ribose 5-phosphate isomerase A